MSFMKHSYLRQRYFLLLFLLLVGVGSNFLYAQSGVIEPFKIKYTGEVKGDVLQIGNNILGKDNSPLNDNSKNEDVSMKYIDIDSDSSTLNSSSATLNVPPATTCYRVIYAGLYWGALIKSGESRVGINDIKFKTPGSSIYTNITGSVIYDAVAAPIVPDNNMPYACYADVTDKIKSLSDPQGVYTVAGVKSSEGLNGSTGLMAGWSLVVVYEDSKATSKYINTFDGFAALYDGKTLDIQINGFNTPITGNLNAQYGMVSLGGDKGQNGSKIEINNKQQALVTAQRPSNKFFNSVITDANGILAGRNPDNTNTLGFDMGLTKVQDSNNVIGNNATSATITIQIAKGQANPIFNFLNIFTVDIIAPDIELVKTVKDINGNDVGGGNVTLSQDLYYDISFQNVGNENVKNLTIKDVLPENVIFNYPSDIVTPLPLGVTHTYTAATRTLIFTIPKELVEINDPKQVVKLHVKVVTNCNQLTDACSNEIKNQAYASYQGVTSTKWILDEGSYESTVCNLGTGQSTNFLVGVQNCKYVHNEVMCNPATGVLLKAADGYDGYSWSNSPTGTPVLGTGQSYTATALGTYYVSASSVSCIPIVEEITVIPFGNTITNPVIPFADKVVICPNDGKDLPYIFLCGANATRGIQTTISDASTIIWEKLNEASCPPIGIQDCANEGSSCTWTQVGIGTNYVANAAGQYRIRLNYPGGCFSRFYFNVYQNLLNPTETHKDIICNTPGNITVGAVPAGYEYSLDNANWQTSNVFTVNTAGNYTVYIRQVGVPTNPCIFTIPNILIRQRNFTASTIVIQPLCYGDKGSINIAAYDTYPQYYFSIKQGTTIINSVGPVLVSDYTFSNLSPGTYTWEVKTDDGCYATGNVDIIQPALLTATSALTKPITCTDGEITVYPDGGTAPYFYYVNGNTTSQNTPQIVINTGGIYNIEVVDSHNCKATTSKTVSATPSPVHTVKTTNILCYGNATGVIQFEVTSNAGGYTLSYSIDGGTTYSNNPVFSGLVADIVYTPKIRYTLDGVNYCYDTKPTVTLTGPGSAVTASAGVSELAGCGPSGEGKIRITNPQGGVAPYEYSFDNQATWITSNEAYKAPGTYTVYIRDANGCIFAMPNIIIDPKPTAPTIDVTSPAFNCNGTANSTVTVTNPGNASYEYGYLLDGITNTNVPPNIFVNVPSGSHTVSVTYKLLTVPTYSNLLKEDFGNDTFAYTATASPDVSSPGINSAFCWERQIDATKCNGNKLFGNGEYTVTSSLRNNPYSGWHNPVDHTAGSTTGRYLAVDAGNAIPNNAVLYRKTIKDIIPNQPIQVRFFATNLLKTGNTQPDASLTVELQNSSGTPLSSSSTGFIQKTNGWVEYNKTINPGPNTTLDFVLRLEVSQINGIDFAVDDIEVYQLPKSCITQVDFPFEVPTGKAFNASVTGFKNISCAGANDGEITIAVQNFAASGYYYSLDGAAFQPTTTSPLVISGLSPGSHSVQVKYDQSASPCLFTLPQAITAPTAVTLTASVTTQATCATGATITAVAGGGTQGYQYELHAADGSLLSTNTSGVFTNVPPNALSENYTISVKDANLCTAQAGTVAIIVIAPAKPTASIDKTIGLCFDPLTGTQIKVDVAGGLAPYSYQVSVNGGAYSVPSPYFTGTTFTYTANTVGTYDFIIIDSNNCETTVLSQKIDPKITATPAIKNSLSCISGSTDAVIEVSISGGTAPYTYVVKNGSTVLFTSSSPIAGPKFTYSTNTTGTYTFEIKDANNCPITVDQKVDALVAVTGKSTVTDVTCNGANNGSVILEALTGVAPYTFQITTGTPNLVSSSNTSATYDGLAGSVAGTTYNYTVTDAKGCVYDGTFIVKQPDVIIGTAAMAPNYSCDNPATITVSGVSGGNGSYTFTLNKDGVKYAGPQNTLVFNNLTVAGNYEVIITDAKSCFVNIPAGTITALNPPVAMTLNASAVTCQSNKADVTITNVTNAAGVALPTAGLQYRMILPTVGSYQSSNVFTGLNAGTTYKFEVKDANNCTYSKSIRIDALPIISVGLKSKNDVICFGDPSGSAVFTVSGIGNNVAYSYTVDGVLPGTSGTSPATGTSFDISISGLSGSTSGITHTIVVTNTATTCFASQTVTILAPAAALALNAPTLTHVTCNGNGSAIINAVDGWTPYSSYVVTRTNPPGTPITQNTKTFNNLPAGDYTVVVTDLNGCTVAQPFTINDKVSLAASIDSTTDLCYKPTGATIQVNPDSQTNYIYSINGATPVTDGTFAGLAPGKYTIKVTDTSTGCYIDLPQQTVATQLTASTNLKSGAKCSTPNIIIDGTIGGGTPDYTYVVSINGTAEGITHSVTGTTFTYTDPSGIAATAITPTVYVFTFTDSKGCTTTSSVTVQPKTDPKINSAVQEGIIYCYGDLTGSIKVDLDLTQGVGPYVITVVKDNSALPPIPPSLLPPPNVDYGTQTSGLPGGNYKVTVTDANGCIDSRSNVLINEPLKIDFPEVFTPITCSGTVGGGTAVGSISIKGLTGGTSDPASPPSGFVYTLTSNTSPTQTFYPIAKEDKTFNVLNFGIYELTVTDFNGCSFSRTITIASPPTDLDISVVPGAPSCTTASLIVKTTPAIPRGPYHFAKYPVDTTNPNNYDYATYSAFYQNADAVSPPATPGNPLLLQSTFNGLNPGVTYSFIVYDEFTGCYFFKQAEVPTLTASNLTSTKPTPTNVTCIGYGDGSVSLSFTNTYPTTTDVKYEVYNSQTNLPLFPAVTGTELGLISTPIATVPVTYTPVTTLIKNLGPLLPGTYYILFTEIGGTNPGCTNASSTFTITQSVVPLTGTASAPKNDNCKHSGQIIAAGQGGTAPYQYELVDSTNAIIIGYSSYSTFPNPSSTATLITGNYTVNIKDANDCVFPVSVTLGLDPEPEITATVNGQCAATEGNFAIDVVLDPIKVGVGTLSYSLDGGTFVAKTAPFTYSNLSSGTHTVEVQDSNGCGSKVVDIKIYAPLDINASFTTFPTCKDPNGTITAVATGGSVAANLEYSIVNNTTGLMSLYKPSPVFNNLAAGNYTITVKDKITSCTKSVTIDLLIPTDITLTTADVDTKSPDCSNTQGNGSNNNNGSIQVNLPASNNNPPYTYVLTPITTPPSASITQISNGLFTGLGIGDYEIVVTSANGCSNITPIPVTISSPVSVVVASASASPFTCSPTNTLNATVVTVTGSGGAGTGLVTDYTYSEDKINWKVDNHFNVFDNGSTLNPKYYVKDANGCIAEVQITVDPFPKLVSATTSLDTKADCNNSGEVIKVDIVGGAIPTDFEYQVSDNGGPFSTTAIAITTGDNSFTYTASTAGHSYQFLITDKTTGCSILSDVYDVPLFNKMKVNASTAANVDCNGNATGSVEINITDYTGTYTYQVFDGATPVSGASGSGDTSTANPFKIPFGLVAGTNYTVEVTEMAYPNCTVKSNVVTITQPLALDLSGLAIANVPQNCNTTGAVLTVDPSTIVGGTPGYVYAFVPAGTSPVGLYTTSPTKTIATTQVTPLFDAYDIYVKDANGCFAFKTVNIFADPMPTIPSVTVDSQCADSDGYKITVSASGVVPLQYSLDGVQFQDDNFFTVFAPGNYTVTAMDKNQCTATVTTPVTILEPLGLHAEVSIMPTCTAADGEIKLYASGGTVPSSYEYTNVNSGIIQPSPIFGGLAPGSYTFTVKDLGTGCTKDVIQVIDTPTQVIGITPSATPVSCNGGSDGSISVALATSNDNPVYMYSLSGTETRPAQKSNLFAGLAAGSYTVDVVSGRGCPGTSTITVGGPGVITVTAPTPIQFGCTAGNTTNFATITIDPLTDVTGGSGIYKIYEFIKGGTLVQRGSSNTYTESDLAGGNYIINVFDDKGCQGSTATPIVINPFISLDKINVSVNKAITCNNFEDITVTVSSIGGTPANLQYTLVDKNATTGVIGGVYPSQTNTTGVFTGLPVANYLITVKNLDTNCEIHDVHYVSEPNTFDLTIDNIVDVTCFGDANGSVNVTIVDKTITATDPDQAGAFTYTLVDSLGNSLPGGTSSNAGPTSLTNLAAGTYTITTTLTNSPFCSVSKAFTINGPNEALKISETHTEITCVTGNNDGTISVNAIGGWPGDYEFELSGPINVAYSTQTDFTNLTAGLYTIKVRDSKGCVKQVTVNLSNPTPIVAAIVADKTIVNCFGDASATITVQQPVTGGSLIYNYTLEATYANGTVTLNGPQTSNVFDNLGAASYKVIVSDTWNCSVATNTVVINQPTVVQANLVVATTQTCANNTQLTLTASGGTAPYTYSDTANGTYSSTFDPSVTISVPVGTYHYYVKDFNGCMSVVSNDITIDPLPALIVNLDLSDAIVNCQGESTASIIAIAEGGLGNYQYTLFDGSNNSLVGPQPTGVFSGLGAGTYYVSVQSGVDCNAVSATVTLTDPPLLQIVNPVIQTDVLCNGDKNGAITINTTGGTGIIQLAISPNLNQFFSANASGGFTFTDLAAGTYQVLVQDQAGCFILRDVTINEPAVLNATVASIQQELCKGDKGGFTLDITGGTSPYFTSLNDEDHYVLYDPSKPTYTGLDGGQMYIIYIKDSHDCQTGQIAVLNPSVDLQLSLASSDQCTGNAPSHTITASVNSALNPSDVSYSLDGTNYSSSNVFPNLADGTYTVYAKHTNGCVKSDTITIAPKLPVAANVSSKVDVTCNGSSTGSITVTGSDGTQPYQYAISPNFVYGSSSTFNNLAAGTYEIRVKDAIGCEVILNDNTTTITQPTAIIVTKTNVTQEICAGDKTGSITISVSGGVGPYFTSMNPNANFVQDQYTFSNLNGGKTYIIYVKDSNNCLVQNVTTLDAPISIKASVAVNYDCVKHTAVVKVDPSVVNSVTYSLDNGPYQVPNTFDNIAPGNHLISVKHQNNQCFNTVSFSVKSIKPLLLTLEESGINEFKAIAEGGSGIYTYTLNGEDKGSQNVFQIKKSGTYVVVVTDTNGCTAQQSIEMVYHDIDFPDNFTPNGDGYHDSWSPENVRDYPNLVVDVFDRYGRKVSVLEIGQSWNGEYNGAPLPTGDYWYIVKLGAEGNNKEFVGHFTLYR